MCLLRLICRSNIHNISAGKRRRNPWPTSPYLLNAKRKEAKEKGYISTILGRIRYFPDLNSKNFQLRNRAYRELINFPIQGSAADMTKSAMVTIYNSISKFKGWNLILQIHDELLFEVEENALKDKSSLNAIKEIMNSVMPLSVPVLVESNESSTWVK